MQRRIEGTFEPSQSEVVVDDVITTGGSTIQAIDAIAFVRVLMDREEGGRQAIRTKGYDVVSIFTRADVSPANAEHSANIEAVIRTLDYA